MKDISEIVEQAGSKISAMQIIAARAIELDGDIRSIWFNNDNGHLMLVRHNDGVTFDIDVDGTYVIND